MAPLSPVISKRPPPSPPSDPTESRPAKRQVVDGLPAAAELSGKATASEDAVMSGPKELEEEEAMGNLSVPGTSTVVPGAEALNGTANPHSPKKQEEKKVYGRDKKPKKANKDWNAKNSNTWMARNTEDGVSDARGNGEGKGRLPKKKAAILIG